MAFGPPFVSVRESTSLRIANHGSTQAFTVRYFLAKSLDHPIYCYAATTPARCTIADDDGEFDDAGIFFESGRQNGDGERSETARTSRSARHPARRRDCRGVGFKDRRPRIASAGLADKHVPAKQSIMPIYAVRGDMIYQPLMVVRP